MRLRTSRSASREDSAPKRSARSPERPIVLPSRIPETESDSCTIEETSASEACSSAVTCPPPVADALRQVHEQRQEREREDGEAPVEEQHRDDGGQDGGHVGDDRGGGRGDDVLDPADVVGDPALHLAGARAREEGEREPLQVPVDGGAQVVHDRLADAVREQRLPDAEHAGGDRDGDHPGHERGQEAHVLVRDGDVEHLAQQERGDDAERGRDEDQRVDGQQRPPVRAEEGDDPAEVRLAHRRVGGTLRCLTGREASPAPSTCHA